MAPDPDPGAGPSRPDEADDHARLVRGGWRRAAATPTTSAAVPPVGDVRSSGATLVDDGEHVVDLVEERATPRTTGAPTDRTDGRATASAAPGDAGGMETSAPDTDAVGPGGLDDEAPAPADAAAPSGRRHRWGGRRRAARAARAAREAREATQQHESTHDREAAHDDEARADEAPVVGATHDADPAAAADVAPVADATTDHSAEDDSAIELWVEPEAPAEDDVDGAPVAPAARGRRRRRRARRLPTAGAGPRSQARRDARRARVRRLVLGVLGVAVAAVALVVAGPPLLDALRDRGDDAATEASAQAPAEDAPPVADDVTAPADGPTTVLLTTTDGAGDGGAVGAVVLGLDPATGDGTILLVPTTLATDVPGFGLLQLAGAEQVGGAQLVGLTLTNLLGIPFDATATLTELDWAALFARVGGFEVDVREALTVTTDGTREVRFQPGPQFLDGQRLAELLTLRQEAEPELAALPRAATVLEGLLRQADGDDLEALFEDGAPMVRAEDPGAVETVVRGLVAAAAEDRLDVRTLPVTPIGTGDDASYRLDEPGAEALVADRFAGATVTDETAVSTGLRLEIRNGVGTPGIGARVTELLVPLGHEVVLTGNAERFDVATTRVIVYDDDPELVRAAQGIVASLGVGRVELSAVPQGITDATILVGADFRP